MQSLEGQFDDSTEQLFEVGLKLEQKEKVIYLRIPDNFWMDLLVQ